MPSRTVVATSTSNPRRRRMLARADPLTESSSTNKTRRRCEAIGACGSGVDWGSNDGSIGGKYVGKDHGEPAAVAGAASLPVGSIKGVVISSPLDGLGSIVLPYVPATQSAPVVKQGAATFKTTGVVEGISEDVPVYYNGDPSQNAILTGQIAIVGDAGEFSDEGDSGALVCTPDLHPMGLIAGGSSGTDTVPVPHTFASPIQVILDCYQVSIKV